MVMNFDALYFVAAGHHEWYCGSSAAGDTLASIFVFRLLHVPLQPNFSKWVKRASNRARRPLKALSLYSGTLCHRR